MNETSNNLIRKDFLIFGQLRILCVHVGWDVSYPDEPKIKPFEYTSDKVTQFTTEELRALEK
jgi:hypothetical protein